MLSPKRTKYRKYHRGRMRGTKTRGNEICFGNFGLQAQEPSWITSRQIEAARRTITRYTKRGAKLWIRIFPDKTVTARAAESRMGSGKGAVTVLSGKILIHNFAPRFVYRVIVRRAASI